MSVKLSASVALYTALLIRDLCASVVNVMRSNRNSITVVLCL